MTPPQTNVTLIQIANIGSPPDDPGLALKGTIFVPDPVFWGPGPYHCFVGTHAPHFTGDGTLGACAQVLQDLCDLGGFLCLGFGCRSLNPIPGQTTTGKYPQQTNDCSIAVRYMRKTGKIATVHSFQVTNFVGETGGSGSGHHAIYRAIFGTEFDDKADAALCLSPEVDASDRDADVPPGSPFITKTAEYLDVDPSNLPELFNRSPVAGDLANAKPIQHWNGTEEAMPFSQLTRFTADITAAGGVGLAKYEPHTNSSQNLKKLHSFAMWIEASHLVRDAGVAWAVARAAEFVDGGGGGGGGGPLGIPQGVSALITGDSPIDIATLSNPSVDAVSLRLSWEKLQPTPGTFDWTYLNTEIPRATVANKQVLITIQTGEGSKFFGGNKPNWLYTLMAGGNTGRVLPFATVTSGSPTVTYASSVFTSGDLHKSIRGPGIPDNTYIGIINSVGSIGLSSSNTANTPVNATATTTGTAVLHIFPFDGTGSGGAGAGHYIAYDTHAIAFGETYTFTTEAGEEITIPVFWQPVLQRFKRGLATALGHYIDALPPEQKALVSVNRLAFANATSDDWNIPVDDGPPEKPEYVISQLDRWLNPTNAIPNPGAGYNTQLMIDSAITKTPIDITYADGFLQNIGGFGRIKSPIAGFSAADVGKTVDIVGQASRTITSIAEGADNMEAVLDSTGSAGAVTFKIKARKLGLFDALMAAVGPDRFGGQAIARNGPTLDKVAADLAGDPDADDYLARSVDTLLQTNYPGRFVEQRNSVAAKQDKAPPDSGSAWKLLYDIGLTGAPVAGQNLYKVFGDPALRMNGGTRDDQDFTGAPPIPQLTDNDILLRAGQRAAGYRMKFLEIYEVDVNALPDATKAIHDLLTGAAGPPPPPQPSTVRKLRPILEIQDVNYRDDILFMIADLLKVDTRNGIAGISKDRLAAWSRSLGRHVFYSWRLWNWPEFTCMEERAFRPVFTGNFPNVKGDEVFYLGDAVLDVDGNPTGQVTGVGYYVKVESTADTLPTDPNSWSPFALDSGDFFIPLLQRCRRRFGQVTAVYPEDPRNDPLAIKHELDWIVSTRGLEVASSTPTVFVEYQAVPYKYAADLFVPNVSNPAGSLWLNTDGLVYRAIVKTNGNAIENNSQYALVPFPSAISNYCVYMTAADNAGDVATANDWRQVALSYLAREMDAKGNEMPLVQYDFGRRGLPHVILLSPLVADDTFPPAGATIDERCLTEWGDVIPI